MSIYSLALSCVKEKNHRLKMASLTLRPMIPNLDLISDLIAVSILPRNVLLLINQSGIFWSAPIRSSVLGLLHPPEEEEA